MKPTVVILLSDKRSGSTMFQNELCKHCDVKHVDYSPHTYYETHHWLKAAVILGADPSLFSGGKVYAGYGSKKNARIYMEDCVLRNVPEFEIAANNRELVFQGWEALCGKFAQPVFFEKSPQALAHWAALELLLEWIAKTDYEVKIIGLVRNPLSVMYSAQKLFHTDPEKRQHGWLDIQKNLLRFRQNMSADNFYMCKYEDIIKNPKGMFENICKFIGIDYDASVGESVHTGSVNKWAADPYFYMQLDDTVKRMAIQLGYSLGELNNPGKRPPSMLYNVRQKMAGAIRLLMSRLNDRFIKPWRLRRS